MSTRREWTKNGYIKLFATSKKRRDPRIPDVAPMEEIAPAGSKGLLNALYAGQNLARSLVLPPNVPADRVKMLRDAFAAMTKDEQFLKESEKIGLEVEIDSRRGNEPRYRKHAARQAADGLVSHDRVGEVIAIRDQFPRKIKRRRAGADN